jgi:predicted dehydrogenase/threonine dehydrogenase-like Zn-dependent dehydrogenase
MKQIAQNKRSGEMSVVSVPPPAQRAGMALVKTYFSVISAGTEKTTIDSRKSSMLQRARSQPEEFRKVVDEVKRTGVFTTYKRVMSKLDTSAPLGYSCSGIVLAVDPSIQDIEIGDSVACAGAEYAFHSDVIAVPRNLMAKIPAGVTLEDAAYTTIGAIALQGIRQTEPTLGETVVVIGLGLIGQLTVQMLKANGCRVIGIDIDPDAVALAGKSGADASLHRNDDPVQGIVQSMTGGFGADAVIVTAGTKSSDPIELAGSITRERGRVIVVGAAPMDIPRTDYYRKEIDIRLSRSYGPGRYDSDYESGGMKYPIGYVRWTENRNMQAFLDLAAGGKIDPSMLTTHRFPVDRALEAYSLIEGEKTEPYVGILLAYDDLDDPELRRIASAPVEHAIHVSPPRSSLTIGFIGAGSFASGYLLPHLKEAQDVTLDTVCNRTGLTSADMSTKFGFLHSTTNPEDIFASPTIGTVFISTRHGEHAPYTLRALRHGTHVFVEKPLALNEEELAPIESLLLGDADSAARTILMVGFNRRFAPLVRELKDFFGSSPEPSVIHYYVNAGFLPKDHWTQDPAEGGGRIVGEVCHFIDTIQFLTDAKPVRVSAECIASRSEAVTNHDSVNITLRMSDGSIGIITYVANGDSSFPKERIAMSNTRSTAVMNNFTSLELYRNGKKTVRKGNGDKGHRNEVLEFLEAIRKKKSAVIPPESLFATTRATFRILEALNRKETLSV